MTQSNANPSAPVAVVVNDDVTQMAATTGLLRKEGIDARAFDSAEAALTAMDRNRPPDLVITDLYMPGIDGWRFCRLLRSTEYAAFNHVPILVVSATFSGDEAARITAELGADAFMSAPVEGSRFLAQVRALLEGRARQSLLRVLIVDDSRSLCDYLKTVFEARGCEADFALTAQAAEAASRAAVYDVAVIDYHLPDRPGDDLLTSFRRRQPDCVCVMITMDSRPELALEWMKKGAAAYLRKPFEPGYLIKLCDGARREKALLRVERLLEGRTRDLARREAFYRALLDGIDDGAWIHEIGPDNRPGPLMEVNRAACDLLGYTREELMALDPRDLMPPEEYDRLGDIRKRMAAGSVMFETRHLDREGRAIPVETHARSFRHEGKDIAVSVCRDIRERKRLEAAMQRKSEERRLLLDTIPTQVWYLTDPDTYGAVNRAHADFLGVQPKEIAYRKMSEFLPPDVAETCRAGAARAFRTGKPVVSEEWAPDAAGEQRLIHIVRTPKLGADGNVEYLVCAGTDITDRKRAETERRLLEQRLHNLEKAQSLGRMAGAIAHRFNNQLSVVLGNLELALPDLPKDAGLRTKLVRAMEGARQAAEVSGLLLTYLGQMRGKRAPLDLSDLCRRALPTLKEALPADARLEADLPESGPTIDGVAELIEQVLSRLVENAWESLQNGAGVIRLSVRAVTASEIPPTPRFPMDWEPRADAYACLAVADTGDGIPAESMDKLFDPFFTQKFTGRGLGLAVVQGIVKVHGGVATVESGAGRGSVFRVFFPLSDGGETAGGSGG